MKVESVDWIPGYGAVLAAMKAQKQAEIESKREPERKSDLNLGDLNPLIHFPNLANRDSVEALTVISEEKMAKYQGLAPVRLESTLVCNPGGQEAELRYLARFETDSLSEEQMQLLEQLVKLTYPVTVRTRTTNDGKDITSESYPPINESEINKSKTGGWYMGPNLAPTEPLHSGLFVFKDLGEVNKDNFLTNSTGQTKYIIEIREANMYQTDLVQFITQVSSILGQTELLPHGDLLYEIYYDLMRLGLKQSDQCSFHGLEDLIARIRRGLLTPLASWDLSSGIEQQPASALLVGVPGTGKTLAVEQLLQEETGVFILPLDPLELLKELNADKTKQTLLPRIAGVAKTTGKKVILHVDDLENMVGTESATHSTLLNLMQGIRDRGFYLIASTNVPEKVDPALLQPQRFGIIIYCGLQSTEARYEILNIHATEASKRERLPLFNSDQERDAILQVVAEHTQYYTPRYLAEIATVAKSHLLARIARDTRRNIGLTEANLNGYRFEVADWVEAFNEVSSHYDREGVKKRDDELKQFVEKHSGHLGFRTNTGNGELLSQEILRRVQIVSSQPPEESGTS